MKNRRSILSIGFTEYAEQQPAAGEFAIETMEHSMLHHPQRSQPHLHPFFQVFLARGSCSLMHDFVDYGIEADTLIFSSPGQVHQLIATGAFSGWFISFTQAFFDGDAPPPSRLLDFPFFFRPGVEPFLRLRGEQVAWCWQLFEELHREYRAGAAGFQEVIRAHLHILFTIAARHYNAPGGESTASRSAQLAHHYRLAVENHFATLHTLPDYAELLKVTPNHLNDTVRRETGQSAGSILRERQLLEAKRLLLHSALSISEIAYALQFQDPSYFSRFFRRMTGSAPGAFREEIREKYHKAGGSHP